MTAAPMTSPDATVPPDGGARHGRVVDLILLALAVVLPFLKHLGLPPLPVFALAVLLSSWLPGRALVRYFGLERSPVRSALTVGMSLTVTVAVSLIFATVSFVNGPGHIQVAWYLAIVAPFALMLVLGRRGVEPEPDQPAAEDLGVRTGSSAVEGPAGGMLSDRGLWIAVLFTACWWIGLVITKAPTLGPYGLLPLYSPLYWIGLVGLAAWLGMRALRAAHPVDRAFAFGLASLVFCLHLPGIVLNSAPRFTWLYKHLGVIDYITAHNTVNPRIDVYHNWPGFFAYCSWLNRLTDATSLEYAGWMPVAANLAAVWLCSLVYRHFGIPRPVRRIGLILVVAANWIGEDYFAPQAMAYVMYLALVLCAVVGFGGGRIRRPLRRPGRLLPTGLPTTTQVQRPVAFMVAMIVAAWVMVATHQLTPLFFLATLGLGALIGLWRTWRITLIGGVILVAYYLIHLQYVKSKYNVSVNVNPLENAGGTTATLVTVTSPGARLSGDAAMALTAAMFGLGALGVLIGLRRGIPVLNQAVLSLAPVGVFLVQSYGGEALYRVVMFSQLGLAPLVALSLVTMARKWRPSVGPAVATLLVTSLALAFQPAHYMNERVFRVTDGEVRASQWLARRSAGAIIYYAGDGFPARINDRYIQHIPGTGQYDPILTSIVPELQDGRLPGPRIVAQMQGVLDYTTPKNACSYIVFSPSQLAQVQTYGPPSPAQYERLKTALQNSRLYKTVYDADGVLVLRNTQPGNGEAAQIPGAVTTRQVCDS